MTVLVSVQYLSLLCMKYCAVLSGLKHKWRPEYMPSSSSTTTTTMSSGISTATTTTAIIEQLLQRLEEEEPIFSIEDQSMDKNYLDLKLWHLGFKKFWVCSWRVVTCFTFTSTFSMCTQSKKKRVLLEKRTSHPSCLLDLFPNCGGDRDFTTLG